jgi:hypothetical protein
VFFLIFLSKDAAHFFIQKLFEMFENGCNPIHLVTKTLFKPRCNINTLANLGADVMPGIHRKPCFENVSDLHKQIRNNAWKATKLRQTFEGHPKFGEAYHIYTRTPSVWTPDSVIWLYKTIEYN